MNKRRRTGPRKGIGTLGSVTRAFVGLGSNLGDREGTIRAALAALDDAYRVEVVAVSRLIDTEPIGYTDQPRFLNGVAALETTLSPRELLDALLAVERRLGRRRKGVPSGGPRRGSATSSPRSASRSRRWSGSSASGSWSGRAARAQSN